MKHLLLTTIAAVLVVGCGPSAPDISIVDAAKKGNIKSGVDVLQEQMLTDFVPKGKPHATGGLIQGYATGGVSNLFRSR